MKLNKIFSSHMVFAAKKPIKIYGSGAGKAEITFAGQTKPVVSEGEKWLVEFPAMGYGGPYELKAVFADSEVILEDIFVGEVYLFAGQSNMQFKMKESTAADEMYNSNEKLRLFSTDRVEKGERFNADDGWVVCKKDEVKDWSAIAYITGNELTKSGIAVGAIACYQGASVIESWVPDGALASFNIPDDKKYPDHFHEVYGRWNGNGMLYSCLMSQVIPYSISGVVWYQGESDASLEESRVYASELSELINVWRRDFDDEKLQFVIIQIADYINRKGELGEAWKGIQQAQLDIQNIQSYVKTVISADVCENDQIHPPTKDKLAKRIADTIINLK